MDADPPVSERGRVGRARTPGEGNPTFAWVLLVVTLLQVLLSQSGRSGGAHRRWPAGAAAHSLLCLPCPSLTDQLLMLVPGADKTQWCMCACPALPLTASCAEASCMLADCCSARALGHTLCFPCRCTGKGRMPASAQCCRSAWGRRCGSARPQQLQTTLQRPSSVMWVPVRLFIYGHGCAGAEAYLHFVLCLTARSPDLLADLEQGASCGTSSSTASRWPHLPAECWQ